ncbi:MAG: TRAP transporter small permease [Dehalococcoidales bacterium]|jgi:TRAP-type C4-dicarboxylate transport system permease small subunit|nr:TRAP transporter small permease [Dehalococcoidales bacterium]
MTKQINTPDKKRAEGQVDKGGTTRGFLGGPAWFLLFERFLVLSFLFSLILVFVQVVMRYIFNYSLSWSEELARYIFVWQSWLGFCLALRHGKHIRVDIVSHWLSPKLKIAFELIAWSLSLIMVLFLVTNGFKLLHLLASRGQVSPALRMPMSYAYAAVPVSCLLGSVLIVGHIISLFTTASWKE